MNKFIILMPLIFLAAGCNKPMQQVEKKNILSIGNSRVEVDIAKTDDEQRLGLGLRDSLPENRGMVFIFAPPQKPTFWMKDMRFPLDFIWISAGKVTQIMADVPAEPGVADDALKQYRPANYIDSVLEVNAGWAARHGIKVGDSTTLTTE
ncbi:MAG: DUF192 domain-containing protein [Candidatus Doudnabacteria bacterium]|nr:DUF192 domain-containing protein [Candidatus Doudnabacteria bacterium]